jgi:hypothetical protein
MASARVVLGLGAPSGRPAPVVAVTSQGSPLGQFLTGLLGRPAFQVGSVVVWRLSPRAAG